MTALLAGLALGLAGGAHCAAMCGPLVATVAPRGRRAAIHHLSRGGMYVLLGAIAGAAGMGAASAGLGRAVSWIAAGLLLAGAIAQPLAAGPAASTRIARAVSSLLARARAVTRRHPITGAAVVGALNALLPCGMVYSALLAALGLADAGGAIWFMSGFAAGTSLVLIAAGLLWSTVAKRLPLPAHRLATVARAAVALLLVLRGWTAGASILHAHH